MDISRTTTLQIAELTVVVTYKPIKNLRLTVRSPQAEVLVSAPMVANSNVVRAFVLAKLGWIREQRRKILAQPREAPKQYVDGENHWVWGHPYPLKVVEQGASPRVNLTDNCLEMAVRPQTSLEKRQQIVQQWYRQQLKLTIPGLIARYETVMGVEVREFGIKQMKTRWGSCNPRAQRIWLNLELAKKPPPCLEYVVVHEMAHLLEPKHNRRFWCLLDQFYPQWRRHRDELNR